MQKTESKYTSIHCHERDVLFWFFHALTLSIDGVSNENEKYELRDQTHVLYGGIMPSRMHLVTINSHWCHSIFWPE